MADIKVEIFRVYSKFRCGWCSAWLSSDNAVSAISHAEQHLTSLETMREDATMVLTVRPKEDETSDEVS